MKFFTLISQQSLSENENLKGIKMIDEEENSEEEKEEEKEENTEEENW